MVESLNLAVEQLKRIRGVLGASRMDSGAAKIGRWLKMRLHRIKHPLFYGYQLLNVTVSVTVFRLEAFGRKGGEGDLEDFPPTLSGCIRQGGNFPHCRSLPRPRHSAMGATYKKKGAANRFGHQA
jgi:hypothetical protein